MSTATVKTPTADCRHCRKPVRANSKGIWGARNRDDSAPWFCGPNPDAGKRHEPVITGGADFTFAGTHRADVRPVKAGDTHGTLILHSYNSGIEGAICYCRTEVADYARKLAASGKDVTATLDHHGNVTSIQTPEGKHRTEFPKAT
jgi:hypothetical protein